jgi:hypothetical protein
MEILDFVKELDYGVRKLPVDRKIKDVVRNFHLNIQIAEQVCSSWTPEEVKARIGTLAGAYNLLLLQKEENLKLSTHLVLPLVVWLMRNMADVEVLD